MNCRIMTLCWGSFCAPKQQCTSFDSWRWFDSRLLSTNKARDSSGVTKEAFKEPWCPGILLKRGPRHWEGCKHLPRANGPLLAWSNIKHKTISAKSRLKALISFLMASLLYKCSIYLFVVVVSTNDVSDLRCWLPSTIGLTPSSWSIPPDWEFFAILSQEKLSSLNHC